MPLAALLCVASCLAGTQSPPGEYKKGVIYGQILDLAGKPVPGATVALQSRQGKVVGWTKTNDKGEYAIPADPKVALQIRPSLHRGLLEECLRATGDAIMVPVKAAAFIIANPGPTVRAAGVAVGSGTPGPIVGMSIESQMPNQSTPGQASQAAGGAAAGVALGPGTAPVQTVSAHAGQADIMVTAPGFQPAKVVAGTYWLEGPKADKAAPIGVQAWMSDIKLAPAGDLKQKCAVADEAPVLCEGLAEPNPLPAGGPLKIQVKLTRPPATATCPEAKIRVFARQPYGDRVEELTCADKAKGIYAGTLTLDPRTPAGETTVCVGALREEPVEFHLDTKRPDVLLRFCRNLDDLKPTKPYEFDPMIMACKNRMDFKVTVLSANTEHKTGAVPPPGKPPR